MRSRRERRGLCNKVLTGDQMCPGRGDGADLRYESAPRPRLVISPRIRF